MKFAFFPGCVLKGAAAEAYTSMQKVCDALGIELEEIPNWTCCGASHAQGVNDLAALAVNARNISIAENMGLPILTVCNTCTLQLRTAKYRLDHDKDLRDKVNAILKEALKATGQKPVTPYVGSHLLRHSLATQLVNAGASLDEVGDVLRHRSRSSTMIYARLDIDGLRSVAMPWPVAGGPQ